LDGFLLLTSFSIVSNQLKEESGVIPVDMSKRGLLTFFFDNDPVAWQVVSLPGS
jgi:hypothetical protein